MSIIAYFYTFNKRTNSTKLVTNDDLRITSAISLKNPTSLHRPTIILAVGESDRAKALAVNYVKFNTAYYWIRDTRINNTNHFEFDCEVDVLATWREEILATKAYILYSNKGSYQLTDNRLGLRHDYDYTQSSYALSSIFRNYYGSVYLLSTIDKQGLASGYMINAAQMITLGEELNDETVLGNLAQYFANPWDSINGISLTPLQVPDEIAEQKIGLGYYTCEKAVGYKMVPTAALAEELSLDITPKNDFRDSSIATAYMLLLPFIGIVPLDSDIIYNSTKLTIRVTAEPMSGGIIYRVGVYHGLTDYTLLATFAGNCNTSMSISRTTANIGQAISALAAGTWGIATAAAGNPAGLSTLASAAVQGTLSQRLSVQTNGVISSAVGRYMGNEIVLYKYRQYSQMEPSEIVDTLGTPTYKCDTISNYTGYIQTNNVSVSANATYEELQQINSLLDGGVYIE